MLSWEDLSCIGRAHCDFNMVMPFMKFLRFVCLLLLEFLLVFALFGDMTSTPVMLGAFVKLSAALKSAL